MKWIKHYSDTRHSESIAAFKRNAGFEGYGRYWVLLEFLAEKFDGKDHFFRFPKETIRELLGVRSWTSLLMVTDQLTTVRGIALRLNENVFEIDAPILLELLGRDFKKARSVRGKSAVKIPKIKNKIKNKNIISNAPFSYEKEIVFVYNEFPRKVGKSKGFEKLRKDLKTQEDLALLQKAVKNYASYVSNCDQKFIKHFSTWVSEWRDWVEHEHEEKQVISAFDKNVLEVIRQNELRDLGYVK